MADIRAKSSVIFMNFVFHLVLILGKLGVGKGNDGFELVLIGLPGGKITQEEILTHTVISNRYGIDNARNDQLLNRLQNCGPNVIGGYDIDRASALKAKT